MALPEARLHLRAVVRGGVARPIAHPRAARPRRLRRNQARRRRRHISPRLRRAARTVHRRRRRHADRSRRRALVGTASRPRRVRRRRAVHEERGAQHDGAFVPTSAALAERSRLFDVADARHATRRGAGRDVGARRGGVGRDGARLRRPRPARRARSPHPRRRHHGRSRGRRGRADECTTACSDLLDAWTPAFGALHIDVETGRCVRHDEQRAVDAAEAGTRRGECATPCVPDTAAPTGPRPEALRPATRPRAVRRCRPPRVSPRRCSRSRRARARRGRGARSRSS